MLVEIKQEKPIKLLTTVKDYYLLRKYVTSAVLSLKEGQSVVITKLRK